jgi:hypothetical protein
MIPLGTSSRLQRSEHDAANALLQHSAFIFAGSSHLPFPIADAFLLSALCRGDSSERGIKTYTLQGSANLFDDVVISVLFSN